MTNLQNTTAADLSAPLYGASFGQAASRFFKKYATFSGRASRSEFWFAYLLVGVVSAVLYIVALIAGSATSTASADGTVAIGPAGVAVFVVYALWSLAVIIPFLAISWRRLHDGNRSGAFYFLGLIPLVGGIIVLVLLVLPSDPAGARFDK
jgi:uncharacterized membrane protein YhaH (DUF805 family)